MEDYTHITIAVDPMGAPRMTQRDKWKGRPVVLRYHDYRDTLTLSTRGYELPDELTIRFVLPFPASYSKKKQAELVGKPHDQKPDIDNLCKAVMDALRPDDKAIHTLHASKVWGKAGAVELDVRRATRLY